jgi:hypothetical protein
MEIITYLMERVLTKFFNNEIEITRHLNKTTTPWEQRSLSLRKY